MSDIITAPGWKVNLARKQIVQYWHLLPASAAHKALAVFEGRSNEFVVTKEEFNAFADKAWEELKRML